MNRFNKRKIINFRPFLCFAFFIAMGILSAYFFAFNKIAPFVISISISLFFIILFILFSSLKIRVKLIFSIFFALLVGLSSFLFSIKLNSYRESNLNDMYLTVIGKVKEYKETEDGEIFILTDVSVNGVVNKKLRYNINVYSQQTNFEIGDRVKFNAFIHDYHETYNERFSSSFIAEKIKYYAYIDNNTIIKIDSNPNIFERVNCFIKNTLKSGMGEEEFSIAYSLLLGKSDYMDEDTLSSFRNTGVAHIFAVSGLHIGFLALALEFLLNKIKVKNPIRSLIIVIAIFFYSGVCGFTASSIRACIMTSVLLLSNINGKKYDIISSLSLAFTVILLYSPMQLFCLGFQLSFGAVFGIILFADKFKKIFNKIKIPEKISNAFSISISAQIITFLIMVKNFRGVSIISILINVLLVPIVGVIFILLFVFVILGGVFSIENIALFIPSILIKCIKSLVLFFDKKIFLITFSVVLLSCIFYYSCVAVSSDLINIKVKIKNIASILFAVLFISTSIIYTSIDNNMAKIYISSNGSLYVTVLEDDDERFVIVNNTTLGTSFSRILSIIKKGDKIDGLVITCDENNERIFNTINRFNKYFNVDKIFIDVSENYKTIFEKTFTKKEILFLDDNKTFSVGNIKGTVILDNVGVLLDYEKYKILLLSKIDGKQIDFNIFNENYDYLIFSDHFDNVKDKIKYKTVITYSNEPNVLSVFQSGNKQIML